MFRKNTLFPQVRSNILDQSDNGRNLRKETAALADQVKISCGITTRVGFAIAFFTAVRAMGKRGGLFSSLLALTATGVCTASYDAMHVAANVEELCDNPGSRVTAARSSNKLAAQLTKNTFFYVPLFKTTLIRELDQELLKETRSKRSW